MSERPPPLPPPPATPATRVGTRRGAFVLIAVGLVALVVAGALAFTSAGDDDTTGAGPGTTRSVEPGVTIPPTSAAPLAPASPRRLRVDADPFRVELRWRPGTGGGDVAGYTVWRDGAEVAAVGDPGAGRFVDEDVVPLTRYRYVVIAEGPDTALTSVPVDVKVKTPAAPLADARLEGSFDVRLTRTSSFGYATGGGRGSSTGGWTFHPSCKRGSCDGKVSRILRGVAPTSLERNGDTYRGSGRARFGIRCRRNPSTSTYTVVIRVVKARVVDGGSSGGEWRATAIAGTLQHREAPQLGCVASGANLTFTGTWIGA